MARMTSINVAIAEKQVAVHKQAELARSAKEKELALKNELKGLKAQKNKGGKK